MVWPCFRLHPEKNNWLFPPDTINWVRGKKCHRSVPLPSSTENWSIFGTFSHIQYITVLISGGSISRPSTLSIHSKACSEGACLLSPHLYHLSLWLSWSKLNNTAACCSKKMWLLVCFSHPHELLDNPTAMVAASWAELGAGSLIESADSLRRMCWSWIGKVY